MRKTETEWALRNLELAGFFDKDSDYEGGIGESVSQLLKVLGSQGHSGFSHAQTLNVFNLVASGKSLTIEHWYERFKDYNDLAISNGGEAWTEKEFERIVSPKPKARQ